MPNCVAMHWGVLKFLAMCFLAAVWAYGSVEGGYAQDYTQLGGELSTDLKGRHALQASAPNVSDTARIAAQAAGFPVFHRTTTVKEGLGPSFINQSCAGCHVNNGRGPVSFGAPSRGGSSMVIKIKASGRLADGSAPPVPNFGEQIHDQSVGRPIKRGVRVTWKEVAGKYADGTRYSLRKPTIVFPQGLKPPRGTIASLRMSPPLIGMGLLEAISQLDIIARADPRDVDRDGISGRANVVVDRVSGGLSIGRFGFKGTHPTVLQQSSSALYHDMGITNPIFKERGERVEARMETLHSLAIYLRLAGVPKARNQGDEAVGRGRALFTDIGCERCHRATFVTGSHQDPELSQQTIHPFTDLLLHDMGSGLADGWAEFSGSGGEWRTTPLWGLGFSNDLAGGKGVFLHDGRARTIEEAILWHGGEAEASQRAFKRLKRNSRDDLIKFLKSL